MRRQKETRGLKPVEGFFSIKGTKLPVRHGTLSYSPERGIRLRTYNRFKPDDDHYSAGDVKYSAIHGVVEDASHVQLYNCGGYENVRLPGTAHTTYSAEYLIYGYCRIGLNDQRINALIGRLRHLRKWLNLPGYQSKFEPVEGDPEIKYKHSLVSEPQKRIVVFESDPFSMSVGIQRYVPWGRVKNPKRAFSETGQVTFHFAELVDIPTAAHAIRKLERFLSLVSQADMPVTGIGLKITKPELDNETDKRLIRERDEIHALYHFIYPRMKKPRISGADPFLYSFNLLKPEFQRSYSQWLVIYDGLRPALDLFFEHRYNHEGYETTKHAFYSFVFEAIHKKLNASAGSISLKDRYSDVLKAFLNAGPHFAQQRLDHYNKTLVDARNLIAHEGVLNEASPINYDNVIQYNQLNQMLITYMVLAACGLDKSTLIKRLTSEGQFTYFQWANAAM